MSNTEQKGFVLWFTGLSGAGKTTIADIVEARLRDRGSKIEVLDGDVVRTNLSKGLGFSREDRDTNIARIAFVADLLARNDVPVITAAISPYRQTRDDARALVGDDKFIEIHISTPLEECEARDVKGLYAKARSGEIKEFTGISDPYEEPLNPEITINTVDFEPEQSADQILEYLESNGFLATAGELEGAVA
ncbi:MAG: adenylyl-sulfate kinase [Actinobacteria bacterium]|nr:adenylyl-sulfate kinase [Actinomycetota bacterium]